MTHLAIVRDDFKPAFIEAMGWLAVTFGRLEYILQLIGKDYHGQGFTESFKEAKRQVFYRLLRFAEKEFNKKVLDASERAILKALLDQAKVLGEERNDMIHALWTTDADREPLRYRAEYEHSTKSVDWKKSRSVKVEEIKNLTAKIVALRDELDAWRRARGKRPPKYQASTLVSVMTNFSSIAHTGRK